MTHNTREGIEEVVTKMKRHVIWQDNEQGMLEDRLRELLHQELQKAREEKRKEIGNYILERIKPGMNAKELLAIVGDALIPQSELDQLNKCNHEYGDVALLSNPLQYRCIKCGELSFTNLTNNLCHQE